MTDFDFDFDPTLPLFQATKEKSKLAQQWENCKEKQPWLIPKLAEIAR